jgi:hypothetical protein
VCLIEGQLDQQPEGIGAGRDAETAREVLEDTGVVRGHAELALLAL